jgi:hypothetical protein
MYWGTKQLDYNDQYIPEEGFCFAALRSWSMRDRKRYIHTLYETAKQYFPAVAGSYINLSDYADGQPHPITIELNIPLIDLLVLQCFDKWLSDMGKLMLEMYFTTSSMVFTTCSARDVLENKVFLQDYTLTTATLAGAVNSYTHAFSQIGDPCQSYIQANLAGTTTTFTVGTITPYIPEAYMTYLNRTIRGYNITDAARRAIMSKLLTDPMRIPAQEVQRVPFQGRPSATGLNTTLNIPFRNVSCVGIVFPKTSKQKTVFENPMLQGLQIKINGYPYPNERFSTLGARFYWGNLIIADLDGALQATDELTQSYISSKNKPDGTRWGNSLSDGTSCLALFQTERGDAGYVFDGLNFKDNVSFEILASPIITGADDTYLYPYAGGPANECPPIAYLCKDTWFEHDSKEFRYHHDDTPPGLESDPSLY